MLARRPRWGSSAVSSEQPLAREPIVIRLPAVSLVLLIGATGSGKSTFARRHFRSTQVLSSDSYRGLVSDDATDQGATTDAFEALRFVAAKRLARGLLTVIDATNVQASSRKPLIELARDHHALPAAIVFDLPPELCLERNRERPDRRFGPHVVRQQVRQLRQSLRRLEREGIRNVHVLGSPTAVEAAQIEVVPMWTDRRDETGPFDIVGDVHGCFDELCALLDRLGYAIVERRDGERGWTVTPPPGRKALFLGDYVDRGPASPDVLRLVMAMHEAGTALCLPGNHDVKLLRWLRGRRVQIGHGLAETTGQLEVEDPEFRQRVERFLDGLVSHYVLDGGRLVVAHAGLREEMHGRASARVRSFALYGETTGETDEFGLPIRYPWARDYRGRAVVVYGHTPVPEPEWLNSTINLDTGCVFGGRLTALRYPERELVSVPARRTWYQPARPLEPAPGESGEGVTAQQADDALLDLDDVLGKRTLETASGRRITVHEEQAAAALEVMSRFAIDPRWLIYLPPTMSPSSTSSQPGLLEHPAEAFGYYRRHGVTRLVCEEKHMGSRAIVLVCRDEEEAGRRFGVRDGSAGAAFTRTGRRLLADAELERTLLDRVRTAVGAAGLWRELDTGWLCLDCELLPWSIKAGSLLRTQYGGVGAAARAALGAAIEALERAQANGVPVDELLERQRERAHQSSGFVAAYRRYCWPVEGVDDLALAPFFLLASEGTVHVDRNHLWHLEVGGRLADASAGTIRRTAHRVVELGDEASEAEAIAWWQELTAGGGEGMVVKPLDPTAGHRGEPVQPGIKCRGREYLRIIYGPEYTAEANLTRLRSRGLGHKRSLALREFLLGLEALERFVRREPLRRVHECVFGVLAMESETVDPRL